MKQLLFSETMTLTQQDPLLVAEDSDEDFETLKRLMRKLAGDRPIYRCSDGDEVLEFLNRQGAYIDPETAPRPAVILLDLNLPGIDGREVLEQLKRDDRFREIPVVVFTTSANPRDIQFCYQNGANGYLIKPMAVNELQEKIQAFIQYWLQMNTGPVQLFSFPPTRDGNLTLPDGT